jgi:hypothetical protein
MMPRTTLLALAGVLLSGSQLACAGARPEPEIASSAPQGGYAQTYPQALTAAATGFSVTQTEVRAGVREFGDYPERLKKPGWAHVRQIMKSADQAGRSYLYVEQIRRVDGAFAFLAAEKDEIVKKVAGSVQVAIKRKGCEIDAFSVVGAAFKEAADKQLEKELRDANEGHLLIERYRASLGPQNVAALEKQVDVVSRLSYLVHVQLVEDKLRIKRMLDEAPEVRRTYEQFTQAERDFQVEKRTTDAERQASSDRIEAMNKSRAVLDSAIEQGDGLLPKLEEQLAAIQKEYNDAFAALLAKIDDMPRVEAEGE